MFDFAAEDDLIEFRLSYLPVVLTSLLSFSFIYKIVSPALANRFASTYKKLTPQNIVEWNVRFSTSIYSIVVSILCMIVLIAHNGIRQSPLLYDSTLVKTNIAIVIGYLISDMIIMIANYSKIGDKYNVAHHIMSIVAYAYAMTYSVMPYFANFRLIAELSSPVVNMRWFLHALGYQKSSVLFVFNGLLMTALFFAVRIVTIPIYWYKVYIILDSPLWLKMGYFRWVMIVTCITLDLINIHWFRKIYCGARHIFILNWSNYKKNNPKL